MKILFVTVFLICISFGVSNPHAKLQEFERFDPPVCHVAYKDQTSNTYLGEKVKVGVYLRSAVQTFLKLFNSTDYLVNLEMAKFVNSDYKIIKGVRKILEKHVPNIDDVVKISKEGFSCNEEFCEELGEGHHAFGVCTPYSCKCTAEGAEGLKCKHEMYYDPLYMACSYPLTIRACGH